MAQYDLSSILVGRANVCMVADFIGDSFKSSGDRFDYGKLWTFWWYQIQLNQLGDQLIGDVKTTVMVHPDELHFTGTIAGFATLPNKERVRLTVLYEKNRFVSYNCVMMPL